MGNLGQSKMGNCCSDAGPGAPKPIEDRNAARKKQAEDDARKKKAEEDAAAAKKAEEADPVHTWTNAHIEGNHQQDLTGAGEELVKLLDGMSSVQLHQWYKLAAMGRGHRTPRSSRATPASEGQRRLPGLN